MILVNAYGKSVEGTVEAVKLAVKSTSHVGAYSDDAYSDSCADTLCEIGFFSDGYIVHCDVCDMTEKFTSLTVAVEFFLAHA